jgi:uncharacterized protein (TIGR02646 family)
MITIVKRKEPKEWTEYAATPGVAYSPIAQLRHSLLVEQGYICAYCMRRIPLTKKDSGESETSKIEHLKPRNYHTNLELKYDNLVVCCPGYINSSEHCDKSKKSKEITFSLFDTQLQSSISYGLTDGKIESSDISWEREINNVIYLNNPLLKQNRSQTLEGVRLAISGTNFSTQALRQKLKEWSEMDSTGKRKPYCGIVIWYLEKKLRSTAAQK